MRRHRTGHRHIDAGCADQPHLARECRADAQRLGAPPPRVAGAENDSPADRAKEVPTVPRADTRPSRRAGLSLRSAVRGQKVLPTGADSWIVRRTQRCHARNWAGGTGLAGKPAVRVSRPADRLRFPGLARSACRRSLRRRREALPYFVGASRPCGRLVPRCDAPAHEYCAREYCARACEPRQRAPCVLLQSPGHRPKLPISLVASRCRSGGEEMGRRQDWD